MFRCIVSLLISCVLCTHEIQQLPHCQDDTVLKNERSLLYVSTLDGKLSALDLSRNGELKWSLDFIEKPLLSSNIDKSDLNFNGQRVRIVPSLRGSLYKFDGENFEAVQVSVEQLLRSSFRYSDDLIFSGGKQTKTYEIASSSGKILRECEMNQCNNTIKGGNLTEEDTLIVQHHQNTVRASELWTGEEKWNFSVGELDLTIISRKNSNCHKKSPPVNIEVDIRAIIPKGLIVAYSKNTKLWEYKFDSPLVSVWREDQVNKDLITPLKKENIFNPSPINVELDSGPPTIPAIYIGMYNRQMYIQENPFFQKSIEYSTNSEVIKYPWTSHVAIEEFNEESDENEKYKDVSHEISVVQSTTAVAVLDNSENINGQGFYLYSQEQVELDKEKQCNGTGPNHGLENSSQSETIEDQDETSNIVFIYSVSIWYWWREIAIISFITAITFHCTATRFWRDKTKDAIPLPVIVERGVEEKNMNDSSGENWKIQVDDSHSGSPLFHSHYEENFTPLELLGSGAYGIVFKAQNKTDKSIYALKRINLPTNEKSRKRMMREAYVLAKLQHPHIVRYYHAWTEYPPTGWQEEHDSRFNNDSKYPQTDFDETSANDTSVHIDVPSNPPSVDPARDALDESKNDNDSYIQFEISPESSAKTNSKTNDMENDKSSSVDDETCNNEYENDTTEQSIVFEDSQSIGDRKSHLELDLRKRKNSNRSNAKIFLYIQMELCREKNLKEWLEENRTREKNRILSIFLNIVEAVEYVHKENMIHRDLKTSNIFFTLSDDMRIVIGDFGLVTGTSEDFSHKISTPTTEQGCTSKNLHTAKVGTYFYMAPELMNGKHYDHKVDIYSLGIILFELLIPFETESERIHKLQNLRNSIFPDGFSTTYHEEFELLNTMLHENPKERPTAMEIKVQLPLLREVNQGAGDQVDNLAGNIIDTSNTGDQNDTLTKETPDFFGLHEIVENLCT